VVPVGLLGVFESIHVFYNEQVLVLSVEICEWNADVHTNLFLALKLLKRSTQGFLKIEDFVKEARHDVKISCRDVVLAQDSFDSGFRHIHASERIILRQTSTSIPCQPLRVPVLLTRAYMSLAA
jgi:hypothetical protein